MAKVSFDSNATVTNDMVVTPIKEYNNLVVGQIESVEVRETLSEVKTNYQFKGYEVPTLVIRMKQNVNAFNKDDRYATFVFKPTVSLKNDGQKLAEDLFHTFVMETFGHMKHILDMFEGTKNFVKLGKLPDIDNELETEELLAVYKKFFEVFAKAFAGKDGKGVYVGLDTTWMFIVNTGEKRLYTPKYIGEGYCQLTRFDDKTGKLISTLDFKGRSINIPKVDNNVPAAGQGAPAAGTPAVDINSL